MRTPFVILLLTCAIAIANPTKDQLVGHWRHTGDNLRCDMTFSPDGTFSGYIAREGTVVFEYAGKWSLSGEKLDYEYTKSSLASAPPGTLDHDRLVEVTKDYYVIEARDGSRRRYSRVK